MVIFYESKQLTTLSEYGYKELGMTEWYSERNEWCDVEHIFFLSFHIDWVLAN